ncbi:uncharacterized protein LOC114882780 [Osmia bicornis bicornis]|uniref:uncharacterized protein LOC114882780 n=1 Tax=Osmia bicornis bicornis TaxID=1437191 RepID=UPI0010FA5C50|nr:uncharacterized protein LOC114882780 [Osmia bicornis bicornis]
MLASSRSVFNIRPERPDHPYQHYRSATEFVRRFVTQSVFSALKIIDNMEAPTDGNTREMGYFGNEWPTCGSFNPRNGEKSVIAEMKSWNALPVTYCFEGQQFLHDLNIIFRPKWLYDILDMKTMMFKTFTF